jgi:pimeloyl-ACP methyl ester carboxylesterase
VTLSIAHAPDGETLAYEVHGTQSASSPIVTVHGLVSSVQHWPYFTPHYAQSRRVLSWEYRGHGGQPVPRDAHNASVPQFADDAYSVWEESVLPPSIVAGLSFGVQVALEMWRAHPDMIRGLVLICGTAGRPLDRVSPSPRLRETIASAVRMVYGQPMLGGALLALMRSPLGIRIAREIAYLTGGAHRDHCPPSVLEGLFGHVGGLDAKLAGAAIASYLEHDAWDVLPTITVPTLIISGDKDQLTPVSVAERMQRAIRGSELVVFPGHTHLVQVEKPREVHAAIDEFLKRHGL